VALDQTSILNILPDALVTRLTEKLITDPDDDAKATNVIRGRLRDDPEGLIIVKVEEGGEPWPHRLNINQGGMRAATYEIGGTNYGSFHRKRFVIVFELHFGEGDAVTQERKAKVVYSRTQHAIHTMDMPTRDDFGERASMVQIAGGYLTDDGGDADFVWNGMIWVEFLTTLEPTDV